MTVETTSATEAPPAPTPVIAVRLDLAGFTASWSHCGGLADYVARFAASDRFDPEALTTTIASHLDEILEVLFHHVAVGWVDLTVRRAGAALVIACAVPVDDAQAAALRRIFAGLEGPGLRAEYLARLPRLLVEPAPEAGILEMAALHGVTPALAESPGRAVVTLTLDAE